MTDVTDSLSEDFLANTYLLNARFAIYLPDTYKDRVKISPEDFHEVKEYVINKLAELFRGATAMPPTDARWIGNDKVMTHEKTTVIYSFCQIREFIKNEVEISDLINYVGVKLNQECVAVEIGSKMYIRKMII